MKQTNKKRTQVEGTPRTTKLPTGRHVTRWRLWDHLCLYLCVCVSIR